MDAEPSGRAARAPGRGPDRPGGDLAMSTPDHEVHGEAATGPSVRDEERQRDDAGRGDHAGWGTQARMFGGIGVFVAVIGAVYWSMSHEPAGTTFLGLTSAMSFLAAGYIGWPRGRRPAGEHEPAEPGHDPHDGVWFPEASIWPLAIGVGVVLVANGLLLGRWLLIPAGVFLLWALAGMIRQGRHRS